MCRNEKKSAARVLRVAGDEVYTENRLLSRVRKWKTESGKWKMNVVQCIYAYSSEYYIGDRTLNFTGSE